MKLPTLKRKADPRDHVDQAAPTPPQSPHAKSHAMRETVACEVCGTHSFDAVCDVDGHRRGEPA